MRDDPENPIDTACQSEKAIRQIRVDISTQIRSLRLARDWSQEELAYRCSMDQAQISNLENPNWRCVPTLRSLERVAAAFDCAFIVRFVSWSEILNGEPGDGEGER